MHTAELRPEMFEVTRQEMKGGIEEIFPDWDRYDRFGIVVHEPWGAIGASLLIQGAVAEFFRRRREAGLKGIYPEIYAIHVGRDWGDLSMLDFWPQNKEVVVASDPALVLQQINDHAITRLAVPIGERRPFTFIWPELVAVKDRVRTVVGYSPTGAVADGAISIRSSSPVVEDNTLQSMDMLRAMQPYINTDAPDERRWIGNGFRRLASVRPSETERALELHRYNVVDGVTTETYTTADLDYALERLIP